MTDVYLYDRATITLNGQPIGTASNVTLEETPPRDYTFSATFAVKSDPVAVFRDIVPSEPTTVNVTMPWGILGPITVPVWVKDSRLRGTPEGTTCDLDMVPDEKALRRVLSMAVQHAIENWGHRARVCGEARRVPALRDMARPHVAYRGERKRRRAMRRLLRAAGITTVTGRA